MSSSNESKQSQGPYPNVRRVITGHSSEGKSILLRDEAKEPIFWSPESVAPVHDLYRTNEHPAVIDTEVPTGNWVDEIAANPELISANGSTFRAIDMPPGMTVPMHRTISIDYGIVMKGNLTLILDDGKITTLKPGDVVVQRGTSHGWRNNSIDEWVRIYFIGLGSKPININGELLPEVKPGQANTPASK